MSLELHLFFARIMKEHSLFLEAGFTPANADYANEAANFRKEFEKVLSYCTDLSRGRVRSTVLQSGEVVTDCTDDAERKTECYTGISVDHSITQRQLALCQFDQGCDQGNLFGQVQQLNQEVLCLLGKLIGFKTRVLNNVRSCQMFTLNYLLLIEHILREARAYESQLRNYQNGVFVCEAQDEQFWNQIMMEHALFIRGSLDPSENQLIQTANQFVCEYEQLLRKGSHQTSWNNSSTSKDETIRFRDFKKEGTKGIINCQIQSIILPLLADHVLREANHYLRLLG